MKKLSPEELDKIMIRDLKRAYNEGIKMCLKSIETNKLYGVKKDGSLYCITCRISKNQLKKLLLK